MVHVVHMQHLTDPVLPSSAYFCAWLVRRQAWLFMGLLPYQVKWCSPSTQSDSGMWAGQGQQGYVIWRHLCSHCLPSYEFVTGTA